MARYIDAEEFKYTILHEDVEIAEHRCKDYESYINGANQFRYQVKNAIRKAPAADVVPREEYEELVYKLECLLCHATGGKLSKHTYDLRTMESVVTDHLDEAYSEGTAEGAKTEAEKVFAEIYEDCFDQFGRIDYGALDQLKKKYTEGEE